MGLQLTDLHAVDVTAAFSESPFPAAGNYAAARRMGFAPRPETGLEFDDCSSVLIASDELSNLFLIRYAINVCSGSNQ